MATATVESGKLPSRSSQWKKRIFGKGKEVSHDVSVAAKGGPATSGVPDDALEESDHIQRVAGTGYKVNKPGEAINPAAPDHNVNGALSSTDLDGDPTAGAGALSAVSKKSFSDDEADEADEEADGAEEVDRIEFYRRDQPNYWLSNSSENPVYLDGIRYPTAEHLFQSLKFLPHRPDIAAKIRKIQNPADAIREARKNIKDVKKGWISQGKNLEAMKLALLLKFSQNSKLSRQLLSTGDADLVEASPTDAFWGAGSSEGIPNLGRNELGKALRRTRETIRTQSGLGYGSAAQTV